MTASPTQAQQPRALSVSQMLHLMQLEVERAAEHDYPVSVLMIGLDGFESEEEFPLRRRLMPSIFGALKLATFQLGKRGLGLTRDKFVLAVFPHLTPEQTIGLAEDLLQKGTEIKLEGAGEWAITLSIGIGHNLREGCAEFETLIEDAETGMKLAQGAGGDRWTQSREVESELDDLRAELAEQIQELTSLTLPAGSDDDQQHPEREWGRLLLAKTIELFDRSPEQSTGVVRLKKEVVALLDCEMRQLNSLGLTSEQTAHDQVLHDQEQQIDVLTRRIGKLTSHIETTEGELKRVAAMKVVDGGIASIYDSVQGLAGDDDEAETKKAMLSGIFEANFALQKQGGSEE